MTHYTHCPNCNITWEEDQTIFEHFYNKYLSGGLPEYLFDDYINDSYGVSAYVAALHTASMYGCTSETPRHFGINVIGIEDYSYDGISYWGCTNCGAVVGRFTGYVNLDNEYKQYLLNHGK